MTVNGRQTQTEEPSSVHHTSLQLLFLLSSFIHVMTMPSKATLTCTQVLSPPVRQISTGPYVPASSSATAAPSASTTTASTTSNSTTAISYTVRQPAWECAFNSDGQYLAVAFGAPDPVIRIYQLQKQKQKQPSNNASSSSTSTSSTSSWVYQSTLSGIHEKTIRSVSFAPIITSTSTNTPPILASASFDGTVAIWEYASSEWISTAQLEGHDTEVKCVRWNATGSLLATCGRDKSVWIWECFLPGTVGSNMSGVDDPGEFECLAVLNGHEGDVKCVRFAPSHGTWGDGDEIVLSASYDTTIKCWAEDGGDWFCAATLRTSSSTSTIWTMALSPSGGRLVAGDDEGTLSIFKCYTNQEKRRQERSSPSRASSSLHFSSENKNDDYDELGLLKCVGELPGAHGDCTIYSVDYAPSALGHGRLVTGGADHRIQILREAATSTSNQPLFSTEVNVQDAQQGDVNCVAWHPRDGSTLVSAGDDGTVRIWKYQL